MTRRVKFCLVAGIAILCSVILFLNPTFISPLNSQLNSISMTAKSTKKIESTSPPNSQTRKLKSMRQHAVNTTRVRTNIIYETDISQQVIDRQRKSIRQEMKSYQYPNGQSASKLEDLLIEDNGKPIRSIVLTTWRSGSTFFGDLINAHPANFYHYEPLLDFDVIQIRGPPLDAKASSRVKSLLNCDYSKLDEYIEYGKTYPWVFNKNTRLWNFCHIHKGMCYRHEFLSAMCKLFPFQSMKLVRLRLNVAKELLADENLAVRMVLLVRDPRGTIRSRKQHSWCLESRDCSDPALLCADMVSDYKIAIELLKKYPTRFRVMRYEDLSANPYENVKRLTKFYGLDFHPNVKKFLDSHTKRTKGNDRFGTFKNTKTTPYHWKTELEFEEVEEIQQSCAIAMKHWGYLPAMNASHQMEFDPVTEYVILNQS